MRAYLSLLVGVMLFGVTPAIGDDTWPQWGGPRRNFQCDVTGLAEKWPDGGPKTLWKRDLGEGYSSIVGDGERIYTMYRHEDAEKNVHEEVVVALSPKTGATIWEHRYDAPLEKDLDRNFGPGPHSTPLIVGDRIYTIGVLVKMHCLDKKTGKVIWIRDLREDYKASTMMYGYGASPLPYGENLILPIGGEGQGLLALKQSDGSEAWKAQDFGPTYASPQLMKVGDRDVLVMFTDKEVAGLNPKDGSLYWKNEHPTQWGANICTPLIGEDGYLFVSSAYGMGSRGIRVMEKDGKPASEESWHNPKMKIHFGNAVRVGDYVYGASGDFAALFFGGVNVKTGKFAFRNKEVGKASCLSADGKLIILNESGELILAKVEGKQLNILCKASICDNNAWTVPTLIGKTLFVRDRKKIMAVDLG